jgi:hypothetical protein
MDGGHSNHDKQLHQHRRLRTTPHPDEPSSDLEERFFGGNDNSHEDDYDDSHHHVVVSGSGGGGSSLRQQSRCVSFRRESSEGLSSMGSPGGTLRGSRRGSTESLQGSAAESTTIPMTTPDGAVRAVRALYSVRVVNAMNMFFLTNCTSLLFFHPEVDGPIRRARSDKRIVESTIAGFAIVRQEGFAQTTRKGSLGRTTVKARIANGQCGNWSHCRRRQQE